MRPLDSIRRRLAAASLIAATFAQVLPARAQPLAPPAKSPVLEPPVVETTVEASYPEEARQAGREGDVTLKLEIDATGAVTAAEVVSPELGSGLEEAARAAVLQFRFKPATRDGKPIGSRIEYVYQFRLAEQPRPTAEIKRSLRGKLLVRTASATPISSATLKLRLSDGRLLQITSGADGSFAFEDLPAGKHRLEIAAPGFEPLSLEESFGTAEARQVVYRLSVATNTMEVVVRGLKDEEPPTREVIERPLSRQELARIPGAGGDALKAVTSLPGFARAPGFLGLLIVRGSAPEDSQVYVDGTAVPLAYHFGGLSTVIPTESLDRIDFYPSNFSVRYGRSTGGVIDIAMRSPDTQCRLNGKDTDERDCFHGLLQSDLVDFRAMLSGPIADDWSFSIAGRRSWLDAWLGPVLEGAGVASDLAAPVYYDYQGVVEYRPSSTDRLSFRVFGSDDAFRLVIDEPDSPSQSSLGLATRFVKGQVVYETKLDSTVNLNAMLSVGYQSNEFGVGPQTFDVETVPIEWRLEVGWRPAKWLSSRAGLDWNVEPTSVAVTAAPPTPPGEQEPGPIVSTNLLTTNTDEVEHRPAAYLEAEFRPHDRVALTPGIRLDYTRATEQFTVDPRFHARFAVAGAGLENPDRKVRTLLRTGFGLFSQPPGFQETNEVFGTPSVDAEHALHATVGIEQRFLPQLSLAVDGYYKHLFDLAVRRLDARGVYQYENVGAGRSFGAEVLLRYDPDDLFFGWLAYTLSRTSRDSGPGTPEVLYDFDQTHNLTVLGSFKLGDGWELGGRFRLISGSPYTPVSSALPGVYAADGTEYVSIPGEKNSQRLPLTHQLDLRLDKKWQFEHWAFSAYIDVQNVYNFRPREAIAYSYDFSQSTYLLGLTVLPSIGLKGEF